MDVVQEGCVRRVCRICFFGAEQFATKAGRTQITDGHRFGALGGNVPYLAGHHIAGNRAAGRQSAPRTAVAA